MLVSLGVLVDDGLLIVVHKLVGLAVSVGVFSKYDTLTVLLMPPNATITIVRLVEVLVPGTVILGVRVTVGT